MPRLSVPLLLLVALLAVSSPAQASDAQVRKVVVTQEKAVDKAAAAFTVDGQDAFSAVGREEARLGIIAFRRTLKRAVKAVEDTRATGTAAARSRTRYLAALERTGVGLKTFSSGLVAFDPDAPAKSATLVRRARAQLASAAEARDAARRLAVRA